MLRRKLAASRTVSQALDGEYQRNEAILAQLRAIMSIPTSSQVRTDRGPNFAFLAGTDSAKSAGISAIQTSRQPITTNTTFTLSQLPALRSILAELRPRLAKLNSGHWGVESAKDERREERRDYIEQRTKMHLERNGHVTGDEAASLSGRNVDPDELAALEKVAATFNST